MAYEETLVGKRVFFMTRSANRDGSAVSGLMIVKNLIEAGASVQVCFGHDGAVIEDYKRLGCECMVVPHGNWLRPGGLVRSVRKFLNEWSVGRKLAKRMSFRKPDLVYLNSIVNLSGAVASKKLSVPCVWHLREMFADVGGEAYPPAFGGRRLVRSLLLQFADRVVANSAAVAENVLGQTFNKEVTIVPNAVSNTGSDSELDSRDLREELGIQSETCLLAVVGSSRPVKGHMFFLEVLCSLVNSGRDISVVFAGDFSNGYGEHVARRVGTLGLKSNVYIVGELQDIRRVYRSCDLVCVPSKSESFGRVAVEAFQSRVPIVATAVGGLREIVRHGENGFLVEYGDVSAMADSIIALLDDEATRGSLVDTALLDAESKYSMHRFDLNMREVFLSVIGSECV